MPASRGSHRRHRARSVWSTSAESGRPYFLSTFVREAGLVDFGDAAQGADTRPDELSGGLVVLHVAGEEYAAERQDFVLFGKPVQPFVNVHGLIVALHPFNSLDQHSIVRASGSTDPPQFHVARRVAAWRRVAPRY